jgi:hypothetical protein
VTAIEKVKMVLTAVRQDVRRLARIRSAKGDNKISAWNDNSDDKLSHIKKIVATDNAFSVKNIAVLMAKAVKKMR